MIPISLKGRRALVTGANSGLGAAIAERLGQAGARVAINYIVHAEAAHDLAGKLKAKGCDAIALEADIADKAAVARMFAQLDDEWGGVDILVNNAGIDGQAEKTWELEPAQFERVIDIDLKGVFYCAREALKRMVAQNKGVIVNISSVHETIPWSGYSAYSAAKAGVSMLTKTMAQEAAPHGVRVVAVGPGAIKTPINKTVWGDPAGLEDLRSKIPMGRMGEAGEIANMVTVLASDLASYVTGTTVFVDGGMLDYASFAKGG